MRIPDRWSVRMNRALTKCPVCAGALAISELTCQECDTRVSGRFEAGAFSRLELEQVQFVEIFLRTRGNISAVGNILGVSFPTATKRLDAILDTLELSNGAGSNKPDPEAQWRVEERARIIDMLDRGDI